ncbi:hypothetical protein ABT040_40405, partial [Streptomyces sp. NPDC002688]|uniref:hypothetical protein n=1 Tax=Streptomyces sp. NPDC002688 TaxID=3154423 RepID=UPI003327E801
GFHDAVTVLGCGAGPAGEHGGGSGVGVPVRTLSPILLAYCALPSTVSSDFRFSFDLRLLNLFMTCGVAFAATMNDATAMPAAPTAATTLITFSEVPPVRGRC